MDIGVIGLGNMGAAMAANLINAGHTVTVYNRSRARAEPLAALGAQVADTVADACGGDVVVSMLADDAAVADVTLGPAGIVASLARGAIHVSCSTISVGLAQRLTGAHTEAGQRFVAAPVFGRPEAAAAAQLFVVAAGPAPVLESLAPLFAAIGQRTFVVSEHPHAANLVKLSGNFLLASVIETLGEAVALVAKAGVDPAGYIELLTATLFGAPAYTTYGPLIAREQFEPAGFAATLGLKDVRLVLAAAEELQVPLPIASLLRDRFLALLAGGDGHRDWSAIATLARRDAGMVSDDSA